MTCREVKEADMIDSYARGLQAERADLEEHLIHCKRCADEFSRTRFVIAALRKALDPRWTKGVTNKISKDGARGHNDPQRT